MTDAEARVVLFRHYVTKWFGQVWANIATAWQTEYDAVTAGAFNPILVINTAFDGGTVGGQKQLEQLVRVQVLQDFRAGLDPDYAAALATDSAAVTSPDRVVYPLFPGDFNH